MNGEPFFIDFVMVPFSRRVFQRAVDFVRIIAALSERNTVLLKSPALTYRFVDTECLAYRTGTASAVVAPVPYGRYRCFRKTDADLWFDVCWRNQRSQFPLRRTRRDLSAFHMLAPIT